MYVRMNVFVVLLGVLLGLQLIHGAQYHGAEYVKMFIKALHNPADFGVMFGPGMTIAEKYNIWANAAVPVTELHKVALLPADVAKLNSMQERAALTHIVNKFKNVDLKDTIRTIASGGVFTNWKQVVAWSNTLTQGRYNWLVNKLSRHIADMRLRSAHALIGVKHANINRYLHANPSARRLPQQFAHAQIVTNSGGVIPMRLKAYADHVDIAVEHVKGIGKYVKPSPLIPHNLC